MHSRGTDWLANNTLFTLHNDTSRFEMANNDRTTLPTVEKLKKQKRKRATQRAHATHFIYTFNIFSGSSDTEDLEHYRDRFQEVLQN